MHKGFKSLDVAQGRVYISRDVVFDETIFPFANVHPNSGAQIHSEILLPQHLQNPSFGDDNFAPSLVTSPASNVASESAGDFSGNFVENPSINWPSEWRYFMEPTGVSFEVDPPATGARSHSDAPAADSLQ